MKSFLIVEDDQKIRGIYETLIRKRYKKSHIDQVANGIAALEKAKMTDYTVIIIDLTIPLLNGKEFYEKLKKDLPRQARRTVFISGALFVPEHEFVFHESRPHLSKPFNTKDFYTLLLYANLRAEEDFFSAHNKLCLRGAVRFKVETECILEYHSPDSEVCNEVDCKTFDYSQDGISIVLEEEGVLSLQQEVLVSIDKFNIRSRTAKVVWVNKSNGYFRVGLYWS